MNILGKKHQNEFFIFSPNHQNYDFYTPLIKCITRYKLFSYVESNQVSMDVLLVKFKIGLNMPLNLAHFLFIIISLFIQV